jgi:hypothetical protein
LDDRSRSRTRRAAHTIAKVTVAKPTATGLLRRNRKHARVISLACDGSLQFSLHPRGTETVLVVESYPAMAGHESARTTGLYDRRNDSVALDEVEGVVY